MIGAGHKTFLYVCCFVCSLAGSLIPDTAAKSQTPNPHHDHPNDKDDRDAIIQIGLFDLRPTLSVSEEFSDNIFLSDRHKKSDQISRIAPALTLQSNWQRARLRLIALGEAGFYAQSDDDDYLDGETGISGGFDIGPALAIDGKLNLAQHHEDRGGNDIPTGATEPVLYTEQSGEIAIRYIAGDIRYRTVLARRNLDFDDSTLAGGTIGNNDDRDRTETRIVMRASYPLGRGRAVFGETAFNQREYTNLPDDQGIYRDSTGYRFYTGMTFDVTNLIDADIGAGWMTQIYEDPVLQTNEGLSLRATVNWHVTRLTTLDFRARRDIDETTVTGASGIISEEFDFGVDHELRRWLRLRFNGGYEQDHFEGTKRTDQILRLGAGLRYDLNRFADLDASWRFDERHSDETGHDYQRNRALLTLRLKM